jgi:hypothetical protein
MIGMKPRLRLLLPLLGIFAGCARAPLPASTGELGRGTHVLREDHKAVITSAVHRIDKIYPSMTGPWSQAVFTLLDQSQPELVWITGAEVRMLDATGKQAMPDEFMCHANLDMDAEQFRQSMGTGKELDGRLFTLSQGQLRVMFPQGTGVPVRSDLPLTLITQVLNLNHPKIDTEVRHEVTSHFVRDRDAQAAMVPLYESGVSAQVSLEGKALPYDITGSGFAGMQSGMCIPGEKAIDWNEQQDRYGRRFTGHWVVPPGRQVNHTRCTSIMNVPHDTRAHAIAVHLHPFAESLELRDVTDNKPIFKSAAENFREGVGLKHIDALISAEGVPIYAHHEYELICVYNNTTDQPVDSMAVMYLYLQDPEFHRSQVEQLLTTPLPVPAITDETAGHFPKM